MTTRAALGAICLLVACGKAPQVAVPATAGMTPATAIGTLPDPVESFGALDPALVELGKMLFFDTRLSGDGTSSCATCHDPHKGWGDGQPLSKAYPGSDYFRNAKTLLNVAYARYLYWDGRLSAKDLPTQVRDSITESHFLNMDGRLMIERLKQVPEYVRRFRETFAGEPSFGRNLKAIAAFETTLVTRDTPYDRGELSEAAERGQALFLGRAGCIQCHRGPYLSDGRAHATGVPEHPDVLDNPMRHFTMRSFYKFMGVPGFETEKTDVGFFSVTKRTADRGKFLTPTLRELAHTAPYMHNGSLHDLRAVVDFYDRGGGDALNRSPLLRPLGLADRDKTDLIAFLESLGGQPLIVEPPDLPAYEVIAGWRQAVETDPTASPTRPTSDGGASATSFPALAALGSPPIPTDNPQTEAKIELGKMLFFDNRLSGDASLSCSGCHDPKIGFGDGSDLCRGYPGTIHWRNCQTIVNSAYYNKLFWAGASPSLEAQAPSAARGGVAGNGERDMMEERLRQVPEYIRRFKEVFGTERPELPDAWRAIAAFERDLVQTDTPFDRYMRGDASALSAEAIAGRELFEGKARCIQCHNGPFLTDEKYYNLGVPDNERFDEEALLQITFRFEQYAKGVPEHIYRRTRTDLGLFYRSKVAQDMGKFRTATLRYLVFTPPYMHNGLFYTLEEVLDFYDQGGGEDLIERQLGHSTKTDRLAPLGLNDDEKGALVAFLESLSGEEIVVERPDLPQYAVMR